MAVCLVVVGASQPGSPFALKLPGAWFFGLPGPGGPPRQGNFWGVAAVWVGLLGMARAWWLLCRALRRSPGLPPARLAWVVVLWCVPLLIGPPLLSRDVYIYAAYGDLLTLGLNPYHFGPGALAGGGFLHLVDPIWRSTPAPYGPLFPPLSAFVVRLTAHHPLGAVVGLRLVALAGVGLAAWSLPVVARAHDRDPALAVALGILNPVTLCGFVAGSHNDALMIGLVLAALALASRGRTAVALVVASLAAAVKVPALLAVAFIGWEWMGPLARPRERVRPMLTAALVAAVVLELAARVTGLGWGWVPALSGPEKVSSAFTPTQLLAGALAVFHQLAGVGPGQAELLDLSRALGLVAAAIICAWLCWRSSRSGMVRALGLAFLVFVALGPVIEPWYLTWGLCVLAAVASGPTRRLMVVVGVAGTFLWLPDSWWVLSGAGQAGLLLVICAGGALALFGAGGLARLARVLVRAPAASTE